MRPVSSSLGTQSYGPSVDEHNPTTLLTASSPTSSPASDSVSDSANLQTCISVILESYRATQPWRYQLPGAGECKAHHARGEQGAVSSVVLLLFLWWVRLPAASGIRVPHTDQRWHLLPDTGSLITQHNLVFRPHYRGTHPSIRSFAAAVVTGRIL